MNEFERAVAAHAGQRTAKGVTDICFASGWLAALHAVAQRQGSWTASGGVPAELWRQALAYNPVGGPGFDNATAASVYPTAHTNGDV